MRTRIIAEIGENHLGSVPLAKRMVEEARIAGADIVKFQSYFGKDFKPDDPEKEWFRKVELSNESHFELKELADKCGLEFLSSPFSEERAHFLVQELGLRTIKVASGVLLNFPILDHLDSAGLDEVIVSTGMATMNEIHASLSHLKHVKKLTLLHCTSQYPCPDSETNLLAISALKDAFPSLEVGYSDHTVGMEACLGAAALGATVVEKHFTLNKGWREGTDHVLSLEPGEFKGMVDSIRRIEVMRGKRLKEPTEGEQQILGFVRSRFIS